jgi:hypothetical protein
MAETASQYIDIGSTRSSWRAESKDDFIEYALKRLARDDSDAVDADLYREVRRSTTNFAVIPIRASESDKMLPVFPPEERRRRPTLVPLQEWEGHVIDISEHGFTARLVDMTRQESVAREEADFELDEVSDPDRDLLREGAVFRWTIGYETAPSGSKKRVSQLVFRRLPKWTKKELAQADRDADKLLHGVNWE